ncbi:MAG: ATPase [Cellulomonadaceae bacterium]|nr:ATPase [Cellulomonadaceae bacterium]
MGIELGSTNIKACLVGPDHTVIASGSHTWENEFVDRLWTYPLDAVWTGIQAAVAQLLDNTQAALDALPTTLAGIGISAMMHGYLAFDAADSLLVPFRTWRNTNTGPAAAELTRALDFNMPLRWSASHLYQAVLDAETHVSDITFLTTLAGYVHWQLTGQRVLGVGDASGMFPIDPATGNYNAAMLVRFDKLTAERGFTAPLASLLPAVLPAGADAGRLTENGARLLDPSGTIAPGILVCPPEGDAGTGMVATNAVAPRTGNVSAGTSIFGMIVLERSLTQVHEEIDVVTTPSGDPVAMVHCNNGSSELGAWASLFGEFAKAVGADVDMNAVFAALLGAALDGAPDGGGLLAYNYLAGETITGLDEGRPAIIRTPGSTLNLANFARTQVYSIFATLAIGMRTLAAEGVEVDSMLAHGGLFRTAGVAQRLLAAFVGAPVAVAATAGEGGAWGIAVLAAYSAAVAAGEGRPLAAWLDASVFADAQTVSIWPDRSDVEGVNSYLDTYTAGLAIQQAAVAAIH